MPILKINILGSNIELNFQENEKNTQKTRKYVGLKYMCFVLISLLIDTIHVCEDLLERVY